MNCKDLLGKQKELSDQEIGKVTTERDDALQALKIERKTHRETGELALINHDKWQIELDSRKILQAKLKACMKNKFETVDLLKEILSRLNPVK